MKLAVCNKDQVAIYANEHLSTITYSCCEMDHYDNSNGCFMGVIHKGIQRYPKQYLIAGQISANF